VIGARLIFPVMAAANPIEQLGVPTAPQNLLGMRATDLLLIILLLVFICTALILWAVFIRKPKNDLTRTRVYKSHPTVEERDDGTIRKRKKHKRQRRAHRTRNPTLAEVGGLPPPKNNSAPPPI
jgi:hypothetical protein